MGGSVGQAKEYNKRKHADPGSSAKINRAMPQSRVKKGGKIEYVPGANVKRSCNTNIGNVKIARGARAPRSVTTVVRGDVITICK
jgi:hypothetical protein